MDSVHRQRVFTAVAVLGTLALLGVVAVDGAAAQPSVDVVVDGASVADGENVTVGASPPINVTVTSSTPLNYVEIEVDGKTRAEGSDETTFRLNHSPSLGFGRNSYSVRAVDSDGAATTVEVWLNRPAESREDIREQIQQIRVELQDLRARNDALERRRENLSAENERLRQRVNESDGGGEGLPGFGAAVAVLAVSVLALRRRR